MTVGMATLLEFRPSDSGEKCINPSYPLHAILVLERMAPMRHGP